VSDTKLPKATAADAKAVWDKMLAAGEKPSLQIVADRLSASFAKVAKSTVGRWKDAGWGVTVSQIEAPTPAEKAETKLGTSLALVTGNPTATVDAFKETPEAKEMMKDLVGMSFEDLVKTAAMEQFKTLILMQRWARKVATAGVEETHTNEETGAVTKTMEPVQPQIMGGVIAALSGSFSTSTSVAAQARDLSKTGATPGEPIDGEFTEVESPFADVMTAIANAAAAAE
jgi:hypothetical protein